MKKCLRCKDKGMIKVPVTPWNELGPIGMACAAVKQVTSYLPHGYELCPDCDARAARIAYHKMKVKKHRETIKEIEADAMLAAREEQGDD